MISDHLVKANLIDMHALDVCICTIDLKRFCSRPVLALRIDQTQLRRVCHNNYWAVQKPVCVFTT